MSADLAGARVLLVGGFPPPHGGISVHVQCLRDRLRAAGAQARVLDLGAAGPPRDGVIPVPGPAALALRLAEHAAGGWLVHVHTSGHTPKSWLVALAGALARRPRGPAPLLTLHSGLLPNYLAQSPAHRRLAGAVARAYGRVIAVSERVAGALVAAGVPPGRLIIAPAFTGVERPGPQPSAFARARARFPELLACAVAPSPIYGLRVLLPALSLLARGRPGLGAALFGPGAPEAIAAAAAAHGVEDRVVFLGELDHARALAVIAGSDLFVRPTLADGDALSVREALALGRRVVASAAGFRPPGVRLFRVGDALGLAAQIEAALAGPAPAPANSEAGLSAVLAAYGALLGRGPAGARARAA